MNQLNLVALGLSLLLGIIHFLGESVEVVSGISGILPYVFVKEFLPDQERGRPLYFFAGVVVFWAVMNALELVLR
jgi:hypothetical protein